ncbi:MAG: NAD(P)-dependent oxidoreductase, partial [Acidimicrobiales bacterium]
MGPTPHQPPRAPAGRPPRVLVAPHGQAFAVDAVRQGGGELAGYGEAADALVWATFNSKGLRETIVDHPGIRWVQLPVAGIEHFVESGILSAPSSDDVVWTCAKGTYAQQVAELALGFAIAGLRELPERARAKSWGGQAGTSLYDQPVTVLGGGGITEELLRLLAPFRVHATVVRKTSRPVEGAERTVGPGELHSVLPGALVVFLALALTPETEHVISGPELALMGPATWLVNVARGRHVDTDALVTYLTERRIGGAALDVTDPEPLPDGHPLWSLPNCLITPHVANTEKTAPPFLA